MHDLPELAARASAHLHGYCVPTMPQAEVDRVGPIYFRRLVALQLNRLDALKALTAEPPEAHPNAKGCCTAEQAALQRAWHLVAAYFIWERRPGESSFIFARESPTANNKDLFVEVTAISLDVKFGPLAELVSCTLCKTSFNKRLSELLASWSEVQV